MKKHVDVVAAILVCHGRILCMQKGKTKYDYTSYHYEFPGGKVENGETKTRALMRELKEEMNLEICVEDKDFYMETKHDYPDFSVTISFYMCKTEMVEFIRKEHISHTWLERDKLMLLNWMAADMPVIEKLIQ